MPNPDPQFPLDLGDGGEIIYCRDEHQRALFRSLYRTWRTSIEAALNRHSAGEQVRSSPAIDYQYVAIR